MVTSTGCFKRTTEAGGWGPATRAWTAGGDSDMTVLAGDVRTSVGESRVVAVGTQAPDLASGGASTDGSPDAEAGTPPARTPAC
jgi:hypothetical protein